MFWISSMEKLTFEIDLSLIKEKSDSNVLPIN